MNWLLDPTDERNLAALEWSCDVCGAPKYKPCVKREGLRSDLAGRVTHLGRLTDRRRK